MEVVIALTVLLAGAWISGSIDRLTETIRRQK